MARKPKKRILTTDEQDLWQRAVEKTERLNPQAIEIAHTLNIVPQTPLPGPKEIRSFRIGSMVNAPSAVKKLQPKPQIPKSHSTNNMDKRNFDRLTKGKLRVDGRIDLHGMTLAEAHPALNGFVRSAYADGKRLLLVITGKGDQIRDDGNIMPSRRGVLKQQVPQWLAMAPCAPLVLQVTQATQKHGGGGAYYVYLRRQR